MVSEIGLKKESNPDIRIVRAPVPAEVSLLDPQETFTVEATVGYETEAVSLHTVTSEVLTAGLYPTFWSLEAPGTKPRETLI